MPREYIPTIDRMDPRKVQKIAKEIITKSNEDRDLALESYRYFKTQVEDAEGLANTIDKQLMVESLKTAQAAQRNALKVVELYRKAEASSPTEEKTKSSKGQVNPTFASLSEQIK